MKDPLRRKITESRNQKKEMHINEGNKTENQQSLQFEST